MIAFQYTAGIYKEFELFNLSSLRAILGIGGKPHVYVFRERQLQLEELTKELKRVTEETGVLKSKLQSMKSSNQVHMTFLYHLHFFSRSIHVISPPKEKIYLSM